MLFRFSDITKSYGGTEILRGVSFQVNPGEKVGLVGRNGAGKTTVFRLVTGREAPDSGEIVKINNLKIGLLDQHVDFEESETVHTAALSAFKTIHDIEAKMRLLEKRMETDAPEAVLDEYAELQLAFEHADGFTYAARAEAILQGLGFPKETWNTDTRHLSGGQKNRLGMARLLLSSADVLLLDEPTNHLDVEAVEWLENFLKSYDGTYVSISHDRYFLDRTTDKIIEIENGKAVSYKGNYSKFVMERELRREQQRREFENQQAFIAKTEEFIRRNLEGQKTKQAKSRRNLLERMDRVEAVTAEKTGGSFGLKKVERSGNNVLTVEGLAIGYGDNVLAHGLNFGLHRGEALGIIGGNGTGKTTLLKTLLGDIRELGGTINWGTKTDFGFYSQNLEDLYPGNEVIAELRRVAQLAESGALRSFLARFLFFGDDVFKRVADLSGGEKGRLALAKLIYSQKNVLVLDEPTNHLDIPAREALEAALEEYDGTIITVSHDRFFLDKIATQILSFENDGKVEVYNGNYTEFHDWKTGAPLSQTLPAASGSVPPAIAGGSTPAAENSRSVPPAVAGGSTVVTENVSANSALSKNQRQKLEARIKEIEEEIPLLEEEAVRLSVAISTPEIASHFDKLSEITEQLQKTESQIKRLYVEWEEASEKLGE